MSESKGKERILITHPYTVTVLITHCYIDCGGIGDPYAFLYFH